MPTMLELEFDLRHCISEHVALALESVDVNRTKNLAKRLEGIQRRLNEQLDTAQGKLNARVFGK